jgi:hypothetical protein
MRQSERQRLSSVREHLLEAFRVRGCRGEQEGLKTRVSFISKPTGVTNSHGSALLWPWRMSST